MPGRPGSQTGVAKRLEPPRPAEIAARVRLALVCRPVLGEPAPEAGTGSTGRPGAARRPAWRRRPDGAAKEVIAMFDRLSHATSTRPIHDRAAPGAAGALSSPPGVAPRNEWDGVITFRWAADSAFSASTYSVPPPPCPQAPTSIAAADAWDTAAGPAGPACVGGYARSRSACRATRAWRRPRRGRRRRWAQLSRGGRQGDSQDDDRPGGDEEPVSCSPPTPRDGPGVSGPLSANPAAPRRQVATRAEAAEARGGRRRRAGAAGDGETTRGSATA
jgi:hypothetical protein